MDLEALEVAVREAVLGAGASVLEALLRGVGVGRREEKVRCSCGAAMESRGVRSKRVQTLLGPVRFDRSAYGCPRCGKALYPGDAELDVVRTGYSPVTHRSSGCRTS